MQVRCKIYYLLYIPLSTANSQIAADKRENTILVENESENKEENEGESKVADEQRPARQFMFNSKASVYLIEEGAVSKTEHINGKTDYFWRWCTLSICYLRIDLVHVSGNFSH